MARGDRAQAKVSPDGRWLGWLGLNAGHFAGAKFEVRAGPDHVAGLADALAGKA